MNFTPIHPAVKEKIITLHLAGQGRNAIDRQLKIEGARVSHGSISNIINRYKCEYEQSLQPNSSISIGVGLKETSHPSLKPQNVNGVGLVVQAPTNPNFTSIHRPKPRDGGPLLSYLPVENPIEDKNNLNPSQIKANINNNENGKCLHNQYEQDETAETEEERKFSINKSKPSLSNVKNPSRRSENNRREKEDQDQEELEENIDLGDWTARQPSVNVENNRSERRSRSGPKPIVDLDSDEITETGVIHFINIDREQRRREIQLINQGWQELENERHQIEQMKQSIDHRENNLKVREIKIADIEHLAPSLRQLQQMGADFFMMQSYTC